MIKEKKAFGEILTEKGLESHFPKVTQALSEKELIDLLPEFDGWIIGDDPASRAVLSAGKHGRLKAAVRWGIGMDNVDAEAARELGIEIANTPGMFGKEVGDIAWGYVIALARDTFQIDRKVRAGEWPKTTGVSLAGKTAALVGFGDVGQNAAKRLLASEMKVVAYDPFVETDETFGDIQFAHWPDRVEQADFIVLTCPLTEATRHLINEALLNRCKKGLRLVNVSRGGLIDEKALVPALKSGRVRSAALEVMETEPLPMDSPLRDFEQCIFGCHNASNTYEAIHRAGRKAIEILCGSLGLN